MNLDEIEKRLNDDEKYRKSFLSNPVGTLESSGLQLPDKGKKSLEELVNSIKRGEQGVAGSTALPDMREGVSISINISTDF